MSQFLIQDTTLEDIGDAVRSKLTNPVVFTQWVKAYTFPTRTVSKPSNNVNFTSNYSFVISTTIKNNLDIDLTALDHWLVYWTSSNLQDSLYKDAVGLYYRQGGAYVYVSHADSFKAYTSIPLDIRNSTFEIANCDSTILPASASLTFNAEVTIIPVKANGDFFPTTENDTYKWNMPGASYDSNSLLPVLKLADIITAIPSGAAPSISIRDGLSLFPDTNYTESDVDRLTNASRFERPSEIVDMSQILLIVLVDSNYIYYIKPAEDGADNQAPIYYCRIGNNYSWGEYTQYSIKFLFKPNSKYLWVLGNNSSLAINFPGIIVYTT